MKIRLNNVETKSAAGAARLPLLARLLGRCLARRCGGFTLEEVVVSMAITAITVGGVATGYVTTAKRAEWSTYSAAAQSAAVQQVEQVRAAKWDPLALPATDELVSANFPVATVKLDLPGASGTVAYVTNRVTITSLSVNPPLKLIRVDSTWSFMSRGPFTNSVSTYRSP
jgi:type II secretory pathway pseudopilin PulG